ncbi:hypothetical protein K7X08_033684 [Anisodus acutangulus]|uniref:Calcium uniporter protein C-terminal domain-containing protein n=1 Tax=Anisodus acutangulus TaxID=402998 RepID=A0A9Q1RDH0_9SOLA|nr:hypothetical protein K7X08_033684 [Anisodus acutangulus]
MVVKTLQGLLPMLMTNQNDPQMMKELNQMEEEKTAIDKKAESLVRRELWCGLGYFVIQTAAFMRLTFWELSWDVMEPICFYVTSIYCMAGYTFFLRTSKEPSFEGFFQSRFVAKQKRLMKLRNFDLQRRSTFLCADGDISEICRTQLQGHTRVLLSRGMAVMMLALIQEEKLVPLYGRGRTSTDPRSKPVPGIEIPRRPAGQRLTAPPPESNNFPNPPGFGLMGGFFPGETASFGNFTMSAGFGGLFPSLFSFQFHGFPGPTSFGTTPNYPFGYPPAYRGTHVHNAAHPSQGHTDNNLKFMFLLVGFLVFLYLFGYGMSFPLHLRQHDIKL